jgi:hypothetical protein
MGMSRGDWVSLFATVVITGIAYYVSGPKLAGGAIVVGVAGLLALHFWGKREKEPFKKEDGGTSVKDSFNPTFTQTGPEVHVHVGDPPTNPPRPSNSSVTGGGGRPRPHQPNLTLTEIRPMRLAFDTRKTLSQSQELDAYRGYVAAIANEVRSEGTGPASGIFAQCIVRTDGKEISRGFGTWANHYQNNVNFRPAEQHFLVLALDDAYDHEAYTVTNSRENGLPTYDARAMTRALENSPPCSQHHLPPGKHDLETIIFERNGTPLVTYNFVLEVAEDGSITITTPLS